MHPGTGGRPGASARDVWTRHLDAMPLQIPYSFIVGRPLSPEPPDTRRRAGGGGVRGPAVSWGAEKTLLCGLRPGIPGAPQTVQNRKCEWLQVFSTGSVRRATATACCRQEKSQFDSQTRPRTHAPTHPTRTNTPKNAHTEAQEGVPVLGLGRRVSSTAGPQPGCWILGSHSFTMAIWC